MPDARADARFADNPLVTGEPRIRFYAGCPVYVPGDHAVGTLGFIDRVPRRLDADTLMRLRDLADLLQRELALHVLLQELRERGDAGAMASRAYAELVRD